MVLRLRRGKNKLTILDIEQSLGYIINNWNAFLWYFSGRYTLIDFGSDWVNFDIHTDRQIMYINKVIDEYYPDLAEHNYSIDKSNELWRTHRNTYSNTSIKLIERLLQ